MGDKYNEKSFEYDKNIVMKIVEKADNISYEFSNVEMSAINNISQANSYKDVNIPMDCLCY